MQHIVPHLWFDKEAQEAAEFYVSIFENSRITNVTTLRNTPSGEANLVSFNLDGMSFMAISAGPYFKINPSISFFVNFDPSRDSDAAAKLNSMWKKFVDGGTVRMPLNTYPFSDLYGWIQDKYGVSWQLILSKPEGEPRPRFVPSLLFVGEKCGKAEEAINFYLSVFKDSAIGQLVKYPATTNVSREGTVMFADFRLLNTWFAAMDATGTHAFDFSEAVSFIVKCDTQEEIDYYWAKLSAVPASEQCGWLKDTYGVSWQIVPAVMDEMMASSDTAALERVTKALLAMKKCNIAALQAAYQDKNR